MLTRLKGKAHNFAQRCTAIAFPYNADACLHGNP